MNGAVKKVHRLKRVIAWLLTAAIVSGNISQLTVTTAYALRLQNEVNLHPMQGKHLRRKQLRPKRQGLLTSKSPSQPLKRFLKRILTEDRN